jgi:PAS domain S-box-containing protein
MTMIKNVEHEEAAPPEDDWYRTLFSAMDQGFCIIEKVHTVAGEPSDYRYIAANPAFERHTGLRDPIGKTILQLVPSAELSIMDRYDRVVRTGKPERFEDFVSALDLWMEAEAFPTRKPSQIAVLFSNVTRRKRAEMALRANEERQAFLLKLSDALRSVDDAVEIPAQACRILGEHLGTDRAYYVEIDDARGLAIVHRDYVRGNAPSLEGSHPLASFSAVLEPQRRGLPFVCGDVAEDPRISDLDRAAYLERALKSFLSVPLIKAGVLVATMSVTGDRPRIWTAREIAIQKDVAERTWDAVERAGAEKAVRESRDELERQSRIFNATLSTITDFAYLFDREGRFLFANQPLLDLWGLSLDDAVGKNFHDLKYPDDLAERLQGQIREVIATARPLKDETPYTSPTGAGGYYEYIFTPLLGADGSVVNVVGSTRDVTEHKLVEAALQETERRLESQLSDAERLQRISTELVGEQSPGALYGQILDAARVIMRSDAASIQVLDPDQDELTLLAWNNFDPDSAAYWARVKAGATSSCGKALATGNRVVVPDVEACDFMAGTRDLDHYRRLNLRSTQSTPLLSRNGRAVGMISTLWREVHEPQERDFRLFDILVRQAADLVERTKADAILRANEERQAFLLELSDALRPLVDPVEIQWHACRILGEHLRVDRTYFAEFDYGRESVVIARDYLRADALSLAGDHPLSIFAPLMETLRAGCPLVSGDVLTDPLLSEADLPTYAALMIKAVICVPILKAGELVATLAVTRAEPRVWMANEIALLGEAAERTWAAVERARVEVALRESEASLQKRVTEATAELRALSRRLLTVHEEERRHLARELHDEVGQMLTGLQIQLRVAERTVPQPETGALAEAAHIVRELTAHVSDLSGNLRPSALDTLGLLPALIWHVERYHTQTEIQVELRHDGVDRRFPPAFETAAYRVIQEALTNIARHSGATRATVQLLADPDLLTIVIRDNGKGFNPERSGHSGGLLGMRERIELLDGRFSIDASRGSGTVITAELPIPDSNDQGTFP